MPTWRELSRGDRLSVATDYMLGVVLIVVALPQFPSGKGYLGAIYIAAGLIWFATGRMHLLSTKRRVRSEWAAERYRAAAAAEWQSVQRLLSSLADKDERGEQL